MDAEDSIFQPTPPSETPSPTKAAWARFRVVALDPFNLLLLGAVVGLLLTSAYVKQQQVGVILQVIASIAAAILGGRIAKYLDELTEGSILEARGKVAVRGLKLLLRNVGSLEERVKKFQSRDDHIRGNPDVTARNYEEIVSACRLIQEETVSAIENWTDIVAEANIQSVIGEISSLKTSIDQLVSEREELRKEAAQAQTGKTKELSAALQAKDAELEKVRSQLASANLRLVFSERPAATANSRISEILSQAGTKQSAGEFLRALQTWRVQHATDPTELGQEDPNKKDRADG